MSGAATQVKVGDAEFNVGGIGNWMIEHPVFSVLAVCVLLLFWIFGPLGFAKTYLEYRNKRLEIKAGIIKDQLALTDMMEQRAKRTIESNERSNEGEDR